MGVYVVRNSVLAGALVCMMLGQPAQQTAGQSAAPQQQTIPDAPKPQGLPAVGSVAPGIGTTQDLKWDSCASETKGQTNAPPSSLPASPAQTTSDDGKEPELPAAGEGVKAFTLVVNTNFVEVPFTVKDNKGKLVPGLTWRDVRIYENGLRQQMSLFTTDAFPLSVALVLDKGIPFNIRPGEN